MNSAAKFRLGWIAAVAVHVVTPVMMLVILYFVEHIDLIKIEVRF